MVGLNALECPICCELLEDAVETVCGHAFCQFCINKALETSNVCPMCRKDPSPIHASFALRTLANEEKLRQGIIEPSIQQSIDEKCALEEQYKGNVAYKRRQFAEAIRHYSRAISIKPSIVSYGNRGAAYFKLKQFRTALEDYEKASALDPINVKILLGKALSYEKLREYKLSLDVFQHALKLDNSNTSQCRSDILNGIQRVMQHALPSTFTPFNTILPQMAHPVNSESVVWQISQDLWLKEFMGSC